VGTRVNATGQVDDSEYAYARRKVSAGIDFLATPPVFDLDGFLARRRTIGAEAIPVLMGILPLRDVEQAEVLRYEVPEIAMPDVVLDRMRRGAPEVGRELARELVLAAQPHVGGVLLTAEASVEQMVDLLHTLPT
jgi:5,10-methylenetetrahydrofolate reductase